MTPAEIVADIAKAELVETIVQMVTHRPATHPDNKDLTQMIYQLLLTYNEQVLNDCYQRGEIRRLIARITINQYYSATSPFYRQIKQFRETSNEIKIT